MAAAAEVAVRRRDAEATRLRPLRDELWRGIRSIAPFAIRNGHEGLANTLNVSFPGYDGEGLLIALDIEGVGVSSGSACMVGSMQASHVLLAMGIDHATASATVRFSLGHSTTGAGLNQCLGALARVLQRQSPSAKQSQPLSTYESKAVAV
jgi:cysteine desulfurase